MNLPDNAKPVVVIAVALITSLGTVAGTYIAKDESDPEPPVEVATVTIAGRIAVEGDNDEPLDAELYLSRPDDERFTATDDEGHFVFRDVPPGTYWILVRSRDESRSSRKVLIEAESRRSRTEVPVSGTWVEYSVSQ